MQFTPISCWIDILMTGLIFLQALAALAFIGWLFLNERQRRELWHRKHPGARTQHRTRR